MNELRDVVGINSVSMPDMAWFIWACCSSLSMSETARRPLTMQSAPSSAARSTTRPENDGGLDVGEMGEALLEHLLALLEREEGVLARVAHGSDDHPIEVAGRRLDRRRGGRCGTDRTTPGYNAVLS